MTEQVYIDIRNLDPDHSITSTFHISHSHSHSHTYTVTDTYTHIHPLGDPPNSDHNYTNYPHHKHFPGAGSGKFEFQSQKNHLLRREFQGLGPNPDSCDAKRACPTRSRSRKHASSAGALQDPEHTTIVRLKCVWGPAQLQCYPNEMRLLQRGCAVLCCTPKSCIEARNTALNMYCTPALCCTSMR